jgi:SET domain-containing protein
MMLVKSILRASSIHGLGVFADQFIARGTEVWKFIPEFDLEKTEDEIRSLPDHIQKWISRYGYLDKYLNLYILCFDDARYINHSDQSNIAPDYARCRYGIDIALRDIESGEEITTNYRLFDALDNDFLE